MLRCLHLPHEFLPSYFTVVFIFFLFYFREASSIISMLSKSDFSITLCFSAALDLPTFLAFCISLLLFLLCCCCCLCCFPLLPLLLCLSPLSLLLLPLLPLLHCYLCCQVPLLGSEHLCIGIQEEQVTSRHSKRKIKKIFLGRKILQRKRIKVLS